MYDIPDFKEKDPHVILQFMKQHPFAMLIGCANDLPVATRVPVLIEEKDGQLFLQGHIMRNTDHHKALVQNPNALFVFTGAHTYVSASWYTNPQQASTWNYMSVHARGKITFLEENALLEILQRTTAQFENNSASPALFEQLPKEYVQRLSTAIVAFEMEVTALDHTFKLSQNRDKESFQNIIDKLMTQDAGAQQIAQEMSRRSNQLFNQST